MSTHITEIGGILDIRKNAAFIRSSGYHPTQKDMSLPMSLVRKHSLRIGDHVTGTFEERQQDQSAKKHTDIQLNTINGQKPHAVRRAEFDELTTLHPQQRLNLETTKDQLTTRAIDLIMPVGKGQRALIFSPPKAGKTSVVQAIAQSIAANHAECHLMVVLVDERPEEVTDMRRSVDCELVASTFDNPPSQHIAVAELAIERAKRIVETGGDVVLFLDSITRLGRAYNLAARGGGRILSGGIDAGVLHPLKRLLGAARNIERGGSLTIFATAMVENGSAGDTLFFEELKSTGNAEIKLDRRTAERRVFPALDIVASGTRKEELLVPSDERAIIGELRRILHNREHNAIDQLLDQLRRTETNADFLANIATSANRMPAAA